MISISDALLKKRRNTKQAANDIFARVISKENLRLQRRHVKTASFSPESRNLQLPIYKLGTPNFIEEGMIIHEVGHALFTPNILLKKYKRNLQPLGVPFGFLNIFEDVRINKLIARRYKGVKSIHNVYYEYMFDENLFGCKGEKLNFINLVNVFFKVGKYSKLESELKETDEWKHFGRDIENLETTNDVLDLTLAVFEYYKNKSENEKNEEPQTSTENEKNSDFVEGEPSQPNTTIDSDDNEDEPNEMEGEPPSINSSSKINNEDLDTSTDDNLTSNIEIFVDDEVFYNGGSPRTINTVNLKKDAHKRVIKSIEPIIRKIPDSTDKYKNYSFSEEVWKPFLSEIKPIVSRMVNDFESKKAATAFSRTRTSDSGSLDITKLHQYQITDDVFLKNQYTPEGKNHGIVLMLDGSMSMKGARYLKVMQQAIIMTLFANRVGISFSVLQFTSGKGPEYFYNSYNDDYQADVNFGSVKVYELFTNKLRRPELLRRMCSMYNIAYSINEIKKPIIKNKGGYAIGVNSGKMELSRIVGRVDIFGTTPIESALFSTIDYIKEFKKKYNIEVNTFVLLTDGQSDGLSIIKNGIHFHNRNLSPDVRVHIESSNNSYELKIISAGNAVESVCEIIKKETDSNIVNVGLDSHQTMIGLDVYQKTSDNGIHFDKNNKSIFDLKIEYISKYVPKLDVSHKDRSDEVKDLLMKAESKKVDLIFAKLLSDMVAKRN